VTHGGTSEFFTFSISFSRFMSLGQHIEVVLTFSTIWVTFILKYSHFFVAVFVVAPFFPCSFSILAPI